MYIVIHVRDFTYVIGAFYVTLTTIVKLKTKRIMWGLKL